MVIGGGGDWLETMGQLSPLHLLNKWTYCGGISTMGFLCELEITEEVQCHGDGGYWCRTGIWWSRQKVKIRLIIISCDLSLHNLLKNYRGALGHLHFLLSGGFHQNNLPCVSGVCLGQKTPHWKWTCGAFLSLSKFLNRASLPRLVWPEIQSYRNLTLRIYVWPLCLSPL